jgi:phospholipid-translocating ATPase
MWVQGDLKDRLGFRHRKAKKNKYLREGSSDVENTPMFHEPHARSASEISLSNHLYQPAPTSTPNLVGSSSADPIPNNTAITPSSSNRTDVRPHSPSRDSVYSHYSSSDLPPPSPPQEPIYRLPSGEFTRSPPPRRISLSSRTTRTMTPTQHRTPPTSMRALSPETIKMPSRGNTASNTPGAYEMRVRNPQDPLFPDQAPRGSSEASSFATANDEFYSGDEDGDVPDARLDGQRDSMYSWDGGRAL